MLQSPFLFINTSFFKFLNLPVPAGKSVQMGATTRGSWWNRPH